MLQNTRLSLRWGITTYKNTSVFKHFKHEMFKNTMFSSMKNVFMEDQDRTIMKNDTVILIQNHYNYCTNSLDQLKSEVEKNTNEFVNSFRIRNLEILCKNIQTT